jgi:hypothetical protein
MKPIHHILDFAAAIDLSLTPLKHAILRALYHLPLSDEDRALFERHTGAPYDPAKPHTEVTLLTGRRGGKSLLASLIAYFELMRPETRANLTGGEGAVVPLVSVDRDTSRVLFERCDHWARTVPLLKPLHVATRESTAQKEIEFRIDGARLYLRVMPAKHTALLGRPMPAAILDEFAAYRREGATTDDEIVEALEPGLAQFHPHGKLVEITSPWVRDGRVWRRFNSRASLVDGFVWRATSREMNPDLPEAYLARAKAKDPQAYLRHYEAQFIDAVSAFLPSESVDACVVRGREHIPPSQAAGNVYAAALDQAYKRDSFVLYIGHREPTGKVVIDRVREWVPARGRPVVLKQVLPDLEAELAAYGLRHVVGDQYAGEPFRELLSEHGLFYAELPFTSASKLQIFNNLKAAITEEQIELLDHERSLRELRSLEATVTPSGNIKIEAPPGMHDDHADCLAVLVNELRHSFTLVPGESYGWIG